MANPKIRTFVADGPGDVPDDSAAVEFELPPLDADLAARLAETHQRLATAAPTVTTTPRETAQLATAFGVSLLTATTRILEAALAALKPETRGRLQSALARQTPARVRTRFAALASKLEPSILTSLGPDLEIAFSAILAGLEDPN